MSDLPSLTVVMPNYNDSEFIGRAIESVLAQDYPGLEYIIVDDGSTDNSVEVIRSYGDAVTLICHETNKGHAAAVNTGLRLVHGDLVNWLNSNDSFEPNALLQIGEYFSRNPEVNVVFGDFNIIDVEDRLVLRQHVLPVDYTYGRLMGFGYLVGVNTMFMRRHVLDAVGLLDESYQYVPDNDFLFRVACQFHFEKLNMRIANWRYHPSSISMMGRTTTWPAYEAEIDRARRASYSSSAFSRVIPYKYSGILRALYRGKRVLQRAVRLHYLAYIPMWMRAIKQRLQSMFRRGEQNESSETL